MSYEFGARVQMMIVVCAILAVSFFHSSALARPFYDLSEQQPEANGVYYAESWKRGTRQIGEQSFYKRLDAYDPSLKAVLKDSSESHQFQLLIEPLYYFRDAKGRLKLKNQPTVALSKVNFWNVRLLEDGYEPSLLIANRNQGDFMDWRNTLAVLNPVEGDKGYGWYFRLTSLE